ncbi:MAG: 50S ribosomal protein L18 [Spiroplasmataceae bacterium]|jgi:large subunit ribosomal protein L18|nr:50S ribosomal protein L18 [Spiroplasmataceae bacterium]
MKTNIDKKNRRIIRKNRSSSIKGSQERPRVVLSESNRYLRVQAIDDNKGNTLFYSTTEDFKVDKSNSSYKNKDYAKKLGENFADKLKKGGSEKIIFDRNGRLYHGKIKVFCQTIRELGINF